MATSAEETVRLAVAARFRDQLREVAPRARVKVKGTYGDQVVVRMDRFEMEMLLEALGRG